MTDVFSLYKIIENCDNFNNPLLAFLEEALKEAMEIEINRKLGQNKKWEHANKDSRKDYRSSYRKRSLNTSLGKIDLSIPRLRKEGFMPYFLRRSKRSDIALESMICEIYINGLSTRKIERFANKLGLGNISPAEVSQLNKRLDPQIEAFRNRQLDKEYPVIFVDALYEKIRNNNYVNSMACMVVKAIDINGKCNIIAIECMENESEETYLSLFNNLKKRGLEKVWLVVSDSHRGLKRAIGRSFVGSSWQRCKVHFIRNILGYIPKKFLNEVSSKLKEIWEAKDISSSRKLKDEFVEEYKDRFPKAVDVLEEGYEDSIQFYRFDKINPKKISSTNTLERLNREIRRRSKVVAVFPSVESYLRLITSFLMEYSEDWKSGNVFIHPKVLEEQRESLRREVA